MQPTPGITPKKAEPRTAVLTAKVPERVRQQIDAAAKIAGLPRSEYIAQALDHILNPA